MKYVMEPKKELKVYGSYDVVVCGGGPAGIGAALSAARNGARTVIIEGTGSLGGMSTGGLGPCFAPYSNNEDPLTRGLALEILNELKAVRGVSVGHEKSTCWVGIDPEKLKLVYDRLAEKAGIKVLYFTSCSGVIKKNGKITAVITESKSGRQAVAGKTFIDATGDADIAAGAGVPFEKGDAKGKMMPVTLCFSIAGIDSKAMHHLREVRFKGNNTKMTEQMMTRNEGHSLPRLKYGEYRFIVQKDLGSGVWGFNFGHVYDIDGTDASDLSFAMAYGRKIAHNFTEYAKKHIPGFSGAKLINTAPLVGVRETRRIKGLYTYSIDDYTSLRTFPDTIAVYDYPVDIHGVSKSKKLFLKHMREFTKEYRVPEGRHYSVPFRSLVPKNVDNLLVAGRSVSSDRMTQGALRVMPFCIAMGEAAGLAAAMAAKKGNKIKDTDTSLLRKKLKAQGARID